MRRIDSIDALRGLSSSRFRAGAPEPGLAKKNTGHYLGVTRGAGDVRERLEHVPVGLTY